MTDVKPAGGIPDLSLPDQALLVTAARRAFRSRLRNEPIRTETYCPPALKGVDGQVHLVLRDHGASVVEAMSDVAPIINAATAAGVRLADLVSEKEIRIDDNGDALGLEFEWIGPDVSIEARFDENDQWADDLIHGFEPAAEGVGVEFRGRRGWTRPSEVIAFNYTPDFVLQQAESMIELRFFDKQRFPRDISYFRFAARHLWQPDAKAVPILLTRGTPLIAPEEVTVQALDAAIQRMAEYVAYRQRRTGWFSYEYFPSRDRYTQGNDATVELSAISDWAGCAAKLRNDGYVTRAIEGVRAAYQYLEPVKIGKIPIAGEDQPPPTDDSLPELTAAGLVLQIPGGKGGKQLGVSAQLLSGIVAVGTPQDAKERAGLISALIAAQAEDGAIEMVFSEDIQTHQEDHQLVGAARALLALAQANAVQRDPRIEQVLVRGLSYYRRRVEAGVPPAARAEIVRAYALAYDTSNDALMSDLVFLLLDSFLQRQVTTANCPWPELRGAINLRETGDVGVDTASYLLALTDGVRLADRIGEKERAAHYRAAVRLATRFLLQLEIVEPGGYYVRSPRDALGGVRRALWDNSIRIDHCTQTLAALTAVRDVLKDG